MTNVFILSIIILYGVYNVNADIGYCRTPDKKPCPAGWTDDGENCLATKPHNYRKGCCCTIFGCCGNCNSGYKDEGCHCSGTIALTKVTLEQRQTCKDTEVKRGGKFYRID